MTSVVYFLVARIVPGGHRGAMRNTLARRWGFEEELSPFQLAYLGAGGRSQIDSPGGGHLGHGDRARQCGWRRNGGIGHEDGCIGIAGGC